MEQQELHRYIESLVGHLRTVGVVIICLGVVALFATQVLLALLFWVVGALLWATPRVPRRMEDGSLYDPNKIPVEIKERMELAKQGALLSKSPSATETKTIKEDPSPQAAPSPHSFLLEQSAVQADHPKAKKTTSTKAMFSFEELVTGKGFAIIGGLSFVLAIGFLVYFAVEQGWISHHMRVFGIYTLALCAIGAGWWTYRRPALRLWGEAVHGTGTAIAYGMTFALYHHEVYGTLIPMPLWVNTLLLTGIALWAVYVSYKQHSQWHLLLAWGYVACTFFFLQSATALSALYLMLLYVPMVLLACRARWLVASLWLPSVALVALSFTFSVYDLSYTLWIHFLSALIMVIGFGALLLYDPEERERRAMITVYTVAMGVYWWLDTQIGVQSGGMWFWQLQWVVALFFGMAGGMRMWFGKDDEKDYWPEVLLGVAMLLGIAALGQGLRGVYLESIALLSLLFAWLYRLKPSSRLQWFSWALVGVLVWHWPSVIDDVDSVLQMAMQSGQMWSRDLISDGVEYWASTGVVALLVQVSVITIVVTMALRWTWNQRWDERGLAPLAAMIIFMGTWVLLLSGILPLWSLFISVVVLGGLMYWCGRYGTVFVHSIPVLIAFLLLSAKMWFFDMHFYTGYFHIITDWVAVDSIIIGIWCLIMAWWYRWWMVRVPLDNTLLVRWSSIFLSTWSFFFFFMELFSDFQIFTGFDANIWYVIVFGGIVLPYLFPVRLLTMYRSPFVRGGLGILWFIMLFALDLSQWGNILVVCSTVAILWGGGYALQQWGEDVRTRRMGHIAMVLGTLGVIGACMATFSGVGNTIALVLMGLAMMLCGMAFHQGIVRRHGLGVLILAIGKVYLVDITALDVLYRILAFMVLGLVLLLLSFLYYRYKDRWKELF